MIFAHGNVYPLFCVAWHWDGFLLAIQYVLCIDILTTMKLGIQIWGFELINPMKFFFIWFYSRFDLGFNNDFSRLHLINYLKENRYYRVNYMYLFCNWFPNWKLPNTSFYFFFFFSVMRWVGLLISMIK